MRRRLMKGPPSCCGNSAAVSPPLLPRAAAAVTPPSPSSYRSSASPLSLTSAFEPQEGADCEDDGGEPSAAADRRLARTIAGLINGQPFPWPSHLESSLSALAPRLTQPAVVRSLDLISPPSAALRFFRWAQRHCRPRVHLDDRAHFKMLQVLCRCRSLSTAADFLVSLDSEAAAVTGTRVLHDRFFNALIRAYGRCGQVREAIALFRRMRNEFGVPPSVFSFNSLMLVLVRRGRTHSARKLFEEMVQPEGADRAGVSPDVCTFNILIRGFCLNSMVDEGFHFFKEMAQWGCEPNVLTYNTLLDGLCRAGKVRIAHNLLNGMRTKSPDLSPTVVSYTTVIRGYCGQRHMGEAMELFREMVSSGVKPSNITYNTLIQGLCEAQRMDLIKEIMEQEADADGGGNFKPDTCTFNTLISAYCNMGCVDGAFKVFAKMADMKVKSDSSTYSVLIRALCQNEYFERAEALFEELLEKEVLTSKGGCIPLMAAYNPIFEYLCRNGKAHKAGPVFRQLLVKGTVDMASCKTMILGHCKEGALRDGYEIVVEMVRRELVPDVETYEALVEGFLGKGDMGSAWKTLQKMLGSGHRPKTSTFHSVLAGLLKKDACSQEACDLVAVMLDRKIRQSIALSTELVCALFKSGSKDQAFETLRLLYVSGYGVKMEELVGFLSQSQKLLEAGDLLLFCLKQRQRLGLEVYSTVVRGLCQTGRASEAFRLFYELTEEKVSFDSSCLEDLQVALEAEGRLREAQFVSRRASRQVPVHSN